MRKNSMQNNPSMRTIQKAQEEWLEFKEATVKASRMSTEETGTQETFPQQHEENEGTSRLRLATKKMNNNPQKGIEVPVYLDNQESVGG